MVFICFDYLSLCPCDFSQKPFCKQLKKACSLGSCQIFWTTGHNWMVVNSVEGVQSNGKWHNNEIYIDCYQYFDDHDHTTNTTPYMAVNSRWLSELEFQVLFTNIASSSTHTYNYQGYIFNWDSKKNPPYPLHIRSIWILHGFSTPWRPLVAR